MYQETAAEENILAKSVMQNNRTFILHKISCLLNEKNTLSANEQEMLRIKFTQSKRTYYTYLQNTFRFTFGTGKKDLVLIYNTFSNVILQYKFAIAVMYIFLCKKNQIFH